MRIIFNKYLLLCHFCFLQFFLSDCLFKPFFSFSLLQSKSKTLLKFCIIIESNSQKNFFTTVLYNSNHRKIAFLPLYADVTWSKWNSAAFVVSDAKLRFLIPKVLKRAGEPYTQCLFLRYVQTCLFCSCLFEFCFLHHSLITCYNSSQSCV